MQRMATVALSSSLILAAVANVPDSSAQAGVELHPITFADITDWHRDAHSEALNAFRRGCTITGPNDRREHLRGLCLIAAGLGATVDDTAARLFFENHFIPHRVVANGHDRGLFTGYYEPELVAAHTQSPAYPVPILTPPDSLVSLAGVTERGGLPATFSHALQRDGELVAAPARADIAAGVLGPLVRPIAWLADPIDAFFLHVQGSGRLRYADGTIERVTYAGKNGHPYTSIGKLLVERGVMAKGEVTMQSLRAWLTANRVAGEALMNENRSYVFFRRIADDGSDTGPIGQFGVALTPLRSLAVDLAHHAGNLPIWLETAVPNAIGGPDQPFRRLMITQDTGSAIRGPVRGDIYFGSGAAAGEIAGRMQSGGTMVALVPRCSDEAC